MNQITTFDAQPTARELTLVASWPQDYASLTASRQPDGQLAPGTHLPDSMRQQMRDEADRLIAIMKDDRPSVRTKTVIFLLAAFPGQAAPPEVREMQMKAYGIALDGVPTWAVEEAAMRWLSGKLGPKTFGPSPPELRLAADDVVKITRGKAVVLRWLANAAIAEPPTPAARARFEAARGIYPDEGNAS